MSVATKGNTEADKAQMHIDPLNVVRPHGSSVRTVDYRCDSRILQFAGVSEVHSVKI